MYTGLMLAFKRTGFTAQHRCTGSLFAPEDAGLRRGTRSSSRSAIFTPVQDTPSEFGQTNEPVAHNLDLWQPTTRRTLSSPSVLARSYT